MRVTASLLPEPVCNAMQEFVCASELAELGYPVSSPSEVELIGDLVSVPASDFGAGLVEICSNFADTISDLVQNGAELGGNDGCS